MASDAIKLTPCLGPHLFFLRSPIASVSQVQTDEFGVEETVMTVQPAPIERYNRQNVFVPPVLAKWLRPHQREGVQFMYQCVMGLRGFKGNGCILADDMGELPYRLSITPCVCRCQLIILCAFFYFVKAWERRCSQ